ncbi:TOMM precursor leader peptide-binding protein [Streptomyces sp. SID4985]|uniref:TOMM precursor leader peptide-binding protein n=1 Tax=Streptomyces sp. SID4985 TaxID=2690292 RepID=UPI00136CDE5E|nr:TOMM precursor leader peptide-binding protein [Streptomyces sp. SID4985]MYQ48448.1 TOMM precursor leader peptide-binding protein [Streptomyces sp. SID4985]
MAQAPATPEEIAQSRPRIRRDVLFTQTPDGVLFHNAHGGFNVVTQNAYRFASLIVPHLNGERRVDELCTGLGDKQRAMVYGLVRALYARGFARDAGPRPEADPLPPQVAKHFAHQVDYLDHYADDAAGRFLRFRSTPVAVLGSDALARWAALGLLRNGCAAVAITEGPASAVLDRELHGVEGVAELDAETVELTEAGCAPRVARLPESADGTYGWADLDGWDTVLVTGPDAPRQILRLLTEGIPAGRRLLGAWTFGNRAVVGPATTAGTPGCWSCAALRLGAGADAADSADLWASVGPAAPLGTPDRVLAGPLAGMLGNLLAFEVFRLVTGALPAETRGQVVVQDLDSLDVLTEPLLPHPRCRFCAAPEADALTGGTLREAHADDEAAVLPADGPADEATAKAALTELERRDVLVHAAAGVFTAYADDDWEQTPLKLSTVRLGLAPGRVREVSAADVHHVAGARLAALFRAAEVYAEHVVPPHVLDPASLEAASGKWTRVATAALSVSSGLDVPADRIAAWSEAVSLLDGRTVLVPTGAARTLGGWNDQGLFERTSAGTGAGGSPRAALTRALRTALAYDALRRAVRRAAPVRTLDLGSPTGDPELLFLLRSAENLGVAAEVLDLTGADGQLPVALARFTDSENGSVRWAVGSGLRPREAVLEALRDLLGAEQLRRAGAAPDTGDPVWEDLEAATLVASGAVPLGETGTTWAAVLDGLAADGRDAFAVPVAAPDLAAGDVHVARVLLSGGECRAH